MENLAADFFILKSVSSISRLCRNLSAISIKYVGDNFCVKAGQQLQAGRQARNIERRVGKQVKGESCLKVICLDSIA